MDKRAELIQLISNDTYGLLEKTTQSNETSCEVSSLVIGFEEIVYFFEEYGREPENNLSDVREFQLSARLRSIRKDPLKIRELKPYDLCNLLTGDFPEITLEDILAHDEYGLLDDSIDNEIFNIKHVSSSNRIQPEYLSKRKFCKDFHSYEEMFHQLQNDLSNKTRSLTVYEPKHLKEKYFFVLNGIIGYLESIEGKIDNYAFQSGARDRFDGRTRCVFSNGTESDMLFRSLDKALQKVGYSIGDNDFSRSLDVNDDDIQNGYIYVLKSLKQELGDYKNLYKIGFTTTTVNERIKNASKQATYLFGKVEIIATFRCYNTKTHKVEHLLHDFFDCVRLYIELYDDGGNIYKPKEWFNVSISNIRMAVDIIACNQIGNYFYDIESEQIIKK